MSKKEIDKAIDKIEKEKFDLVRKNHDLEQKLMKKVTKIQISKFKGN